jgi:small-conductance mechanosensitive channel
MAESLQETRELKKLERAAEKTEQEITEPGSIEREASEEARKPAPLLWLLPYVVAALAVGAGIFACLSDAELGPLSATATDTLLRYLFGALGIIVVSAIARGIEVLVIERLPNPVSRFNLKRVLRLVIALVLIFIVVSVLFVEWYAAVVSLGLISLILGFALQTPISSFIGWIYILARAPYRVGDRIEIGDVRGDVIDVSYLDTTVWEIGGRHLSTDHPSGRVIKFPNTTVFSSPVINYSWPLFPYVWNEIKLNVAYESDLAFVAESMQRIAQAEVGETMMEKVRVFRDLLARTPIDHLEVRERPSVQFRVSENTWVEAIVRYLVEPKEAGRVRTRLTQNILAALNAEPDRVLFPKSNMR